MSAGRGSSFVESPDFPIVLVNEASAKEKGVADLLTGRWFSGGLGSLLLALGL